MVVHPLSQEPGTTFQPLGPKEALGQVLMVTHEWTRRGPVPV